MYHVRRFVLTTALCGIALPLAGFSASAAERPKADPKLTRAIVGDRALQARCGGCIRKAEWIGASYPRVTVDAAAWRRLSATERTSLARRALAAASDVYLQEWAAGDIYQRIFIVDRSGVALMSFEP